MHDLSHAQTITCQDTWLLDGVAVSGCFTGNIYPRRLARIVAGAAVGVPPRIMGWAARGTPPACAARTRWRASWHAVVPAAASPRPAPVGGQGLAILIEN